MKRNIWDIVQWGRVIVWLLSVHSKCCSDHGTTLYSHEEFDLLLAPEHPCMAILGKMVQIIFAVKFPSNEKPCTFELASEI